MNGVVVKHHVNPLLTVVSASLCTANWQASTAVWVRGWRKAVVYVQVTAADTASVVKYICETAPVVGKDANNTPAATDWYPVGTLIPTPTQAVVTGTFPTSHPITAAPQWLNHIVGPRVNVVDTTDNATDVIRFTDPYAVDLTGADWFRVLYQDVGTGGGADPLATVTFKVALVA